MPLVAKAPSAWHFDYGLGVLKCSDDHDRIHSEHARIRELR